MNVKKYENNFKIYNIDDLKIGLITLNNYKIEKITDRFIFISYEENKERKNIKILNAYSNLNKELGGTNEKRTK